MAIEMGANLTSPPLPAGKHLLAIAPSILVPINPILSTIGLLAVPSLAYFTYKDYNAFLSLGPGGTPYNFFGYLAVATLRLVVLRDPFHIKVPAGLQDNGYLSGAGIPKRRSARPTVIGVAPHRQLNQRAQKDIRKRLSQSIEKLATDYPQEFRIAKSCFEKHGQALFSNTQVNSTKCGEVCHIHDIDGSLHMTLHPQDVQTVIDAGWGERHPLSRGGWYQRFVPYGFLMVYTPTTEEEIETVMKIIKASICWIRNERFFDLDVQARYAKVHSAPPKSTTVKV